MPLFFPHSALSATAAAAASDISPGTHFLLSGLKMDTELFSKGNIKSMAYKDTINTTPDPGAPNADNPDTSAQDSGSGDSSSPYSLRNCKYAPYSTNTMKNQKNKEKKIYDTNTFETPLTSEKPMLILLMLLPKILSPQTHISLIH